MCEESEEYAQLWVERWIKARKPHVCCACNEIVPPGDYYFRHAVLADIRWSVWKRCARCQGIYAQISERSGPDTWVDPQLNCGTRWQTNFGELPDDVAALAFMSRADAQRLARPNASGGGEGPAP